MSWKWWLSTQPIVHPHHRAPLRIKKELLTHEQHKWISSALCLTKGYLLCMIPFIGYFHYLHNQFVFNMQNLKNNNKANTLSPTFKKMTQYYPLKAPEYLRSLSPLPLSWILFAWFSLPYYRLYVYLKHCFVYLCLVKNLMEMEWNWMCSLGLDCLTQHCFWDSFMLVLVPAVHLHLLL